MYRYYSYVDYCMYDLGMYVCMYIYLFISNKSQSYWMFIIKNFFFFKHDVQNHYAHVHNSTAYSNRERCPSDVLTVTSDQGEATTTAGATGVTRPCLSWRIRTDMTTSAPTKPRTINADTIDTIVIITGLSALGRRFDAPMKKAPVLLLVVGVGGWCWRWCWRWRWCSLSL